LVFGMITYYPFRKRPPEDDGDLEEGEIVEDGEDQAAGPTPRSRTEKNDIVHPQRYKRRLITRFESESRRGDEFPRTSTPADQPRSTEAYCNNLTITITRNFRDVRIRYNN